MTKKLLQDCSSFKNPEMLILKKFWSMSYPPIPQYTANPDGSLTKTSMSKIFTTTSKEIQQSTIIDQYVPHIYYGIVLLQKLPREFLTFVQISDHIIGHYWKINQRRIQSHIFITDHYREDSVKSIELKRQSSIWLLRVKTINREQRIPLQMKRF